MTAVEVTTRLWALLAAHLAGDIHGFRLLVDDLTHEDARDVLIGAVPALAAALARDTGTADLQTALGEGLLDLARNRPTP